MVQTQKPQKSSITDQYGVPLDYSVPVSVNVLGGIGLPTVGQKDSSLSLPTVEALYKTTPWTHIIRLDINTVSTTNILAGGGAGTFVRCHYLRMQIFGANDLTIKEGANVLDFWSFSAADKVDLPISHIAHYFAGNGSAFTITTTTTARIVLTAKLIRN
jgi:hypothetical protein